MGLGNILMSAFALFHLKLPSLLQYDLQRSEGNLASLYGITKAPCDTHMRQQLDPVNPDELRGAFTDIFEMMRRKKLLEEFRVLDGRYAVAVDATEYFCSTTVYCEHCMTRRLRDGTEQYHHQMLSAALVKPGHRQVVPVAPEPILRQDGASKNDCEPVAFARFLTKFSQDHPQLRTVFLLDSLYSRAPTIRAIQACAKYSYIITAKEGDHKWLFSHIATLGYEKEFQWEDDKGVTFRCGYRNNMSLNEANKDLKVNFLEVLFKSPKKKQVRFCFVTDITITEANYREIIALGRSRWAIENETFNTLKNQGYNFEHNFGHGIENLNVVFAMLMMLAFLVDQFQELACQTYRKVREALRTKYNLWERTRSYFDIFEITGGWSALYHYLIHKCKFVKIGPAADTS